MNLDKSLQIPKEYSNSKKNTCELIRKLFKKNDKDSIENEFLHLTDLESIKQDLFGEMGDSEYLVVRIYIKHNTMKNAKEMLMGGIACYTQEMGAAHIGIQIANRIVHWLGCGFALVKDWRGAGATALFYPQDNDDNEVPFINCTESLKNEIAKLIQKWNCSYPYDSLKYNCQKFSSELLKVMGLKDSFSNFSGPVGEFIEYISKLSSLNKEIHPCIIKGGKVSQEWKSHEELDSWQNENGDAIKGYESLLKAFHRAYQLKGDSGVECPCDRPTMLITNDGEKKEFDYMNHLLSSGSNSSSVPNSNNSNNSSTSPNTFSSKTEVKEESKTNFSQKKDFDVPVKIDLPLPEGFRDKPEDPNAKSCSKKRCKITFSFWNRKNTCEYCKGAFCSGCSKNSIEFPDHHAVINSFGNVQKQRVCDSCFSNIHKYWEEYDKIMENQN